MANEYKLPFTGQEITEKLNKISQLTEELNTLNEEVDEALEQLSNSKAGNVWYGTCETDATTNEKIVITTTGDFKAENGNILCVKFTYGHTQGTGYAYLNVDGTGAKNFFGLNGSSVTANEYGAKDILWLVYDETDGFHRIDQRIASTTYYGVTKLSSSTSSTSNSVAATAGAVKKAYDLANGKAPAYTYGTTDLTAGTSELATGTLYFVYE